MQVESLDLSRNELTGLCGLNYESLSALSTLSLGYNKISNLPKALARLSSLTYFDGQHNALTVQGTAPLWELEGLKTLNLYGNKARSALSSWTDPVLDCRGPS